MEKIKQSKCVTVYCSASGELPDEWIEAAREVGCVIGDNDATLVYGGVDAGLMREVASSVKLTGSGRVIGVVPAYRADMVCPFNDKCIDTKGLDDRKAVMQDLADIFIVLPGGYGTLDELTGALAYVRFNGIDSKKILLFNPEGLYDHFLAQLNRMIDCGLMKQATLDSLEVFQSASELVARLRQLIS